jgi:hypothetical protein
MIITNVSFLPGAFLWIIPDNIGVKTTDSPHKKLVFDRVVY